MIDETSGVILRKTAKPLQAGVLYPAAIIGNTCYASLTIDGIYSIGFIPTSDFWNGDLGNTVQFKYYND